jgi:hypothetical protein
VRRTLLRFFSRVQVAVVRLDNMAPWCCAELRDAMRVGNICFSDQFFSTTQTVREVKQILDDELVRHSPHTRPGAPLTCSPVCAAQLLYPRGGALAPRPPPPPPRPHPPLLPTLRTARENPVRKAKEDVLGEVWWSQRRSGASCTNSRGEVGRLLSARARTQVITLQLAITGIRCFYQQDRYNQFRMVTNKHATVGALA